jgi:hypothetical protein
MLLTSNIKTIYTINCILCLRLILICITTLSSVVVAGCVKSQCIQEIGVFHCWLRIFVYLLVNGLDLVSEDGAEGIMGSDGVCGCWSFWWGERGLGTGVPCPFWVVGGYLGMRPCEKKLKCWLLPMMM